MKSILEMLYTALYVYVTRDNGKYVKKRDHFKLHTNVGDFEIRFKPKK